MKDIKFTLDKLKIISKKDQQKKKKGELEKTLFDFYENIYNHKTDSSQSIEFEVSKINSKALTAFNYLDQYLDSLELKDSDIHDEIWKLRIRFYSLIALDFLVFALVIVIGSGRLVRGWCFVRCGL